MHKRHDFSESVKRKLRESVAGLCSNPDCKVLTIAAKTDEDALCNIGVAAHICAASPGGPRYKAKQSEKERKSYENGIWLCTSCSRLIDVDECAFTEQLLTTWKSTALDYARGNIGKQLLPRDEVDTRALNKTLDYITGNNVEIANDVVSKTVAFFDEKLNQLDNRFLVRTDVINGVAKRKIEPIASDASFSITMSHSEGLTFQKNLDSMRETGKPFRISTESFKFTGSKLFEAIHNTMPKGELILQPRAEKVTVELYAVSDANKTFLGSFKGKQMVLRDGIRFEAFAFNKLISITAFFNVASEQIPATITFTINTSEWNGKDINKLPFFSRLLMAKDILLSGGGLSIGIDFNGEHTTEAFGLDLKNESALDYFQSFGEILNVIECCKVLADKYNLQNSGFSTFHLSQEEYENLVSITELLSGDEIILGEDIEPISFPADINEYEKMVEDKGAAFINDGIDFTLTHSKLIPSIFGIDFSSIKVERQFYKMKLSVLYESEFVNLSFNAEPKSKCITRLVFSS